MEVQKDLSEVGFLLAVEKCNWQPQTRLTWLGLDWDMEEGTVHVTDRRVKQTINSIETLLGKLKRHNLVAVKELAGVTGQIVSMQPAVGKIVQLKSREMFS